LAQEIWRPLLLMDALLKQHWRFAAFNAIMLS